ncbi:hypothetical protein AFLA70_14g006051 [Aspergillus flavus AF70]|nr:hypothetical protein AFLA70_14g006051 [Aspergillus flavus AF70]
MVNFERKALNSYLSCSPQTDILINLSRINVLRAAFQNAAVLRMTAEWMCQEDTLSIFSTYGPWDMKKQGSIAPGLRPTTLQREIPHHPWLDIFPFPRMWDNLIRAGDQLDHEEFAKKWGLNDDADTLHPIARPATSYHLELYTHILVLFHRRLRVPY